MFNAAMERDASSLDFFYDKQKSGPGYPVFSKKINENWDLCWAIEESNTFFWSPFEGQFTPYLEIRSHKLRGSISNADAGECLLIRYHHIITGFGNAYWKFVGLDELEMLIKAHLCLYGLMAPIIEGALTRVLGGGTGLTAR